MSFAGLGAGVEAGAFAFRFEGVTKGEEPFRTADTSLTGAMSDTIYSMIGRTARDLG